MDDANSNGKLTKNEFNWLLGSSENGFSEDGALVTWNADEFFAKYDTDKNGEIIVPELRAYYISQFFWKGLNESGQQQTEFDFEEFITLGSIANFAVEIQDQEILFEAFDENQSKFVDLDEYRNGLKKLSHNSLSFSQVDS